MIITAFFALTTRGLETIVAAELAQLENIQIHEQAYRRVHGVIEGNLDSLVTIRSADDLFLELATWENILHTRNMLAEFSNLASELDLQAAIAAIRSIRDLPSSLSFSVTANFVGKRNYNYNEIKLAVAEGVLRRHPNWLYEENDDNAPLNIRVFIEHERALVGLRLSAYPLHRRAYKQNSLEGSLKAPVAAAMLQLAALKKGQMILDPFCGSGTIFIEAAQQGFIAIGGDTNKEALEISQTNALKANAQILLAQWDAQAIPLANKSVDIIVTNLPWGKQIKVDASLRLFYEKIYWEMRRLLAPDGKLVLLTTLPELIPEAPSDSFEISVYGQNPQIMIFR